MSAMEHLPPAQQDSLLRLLTCGSVDDGKSTLIGRLLYDTKAILVDTLHAIEKTSARKGLDAVDLSLLTDGLQAEREQGITIDVAYRYFSTGLRKYIIADAPGHEQYTRNMVTAASTANLAIILVDARKGVVVQTRRHSYLAQLVGIPHLVVAVNKMDLVDYSEDRFLEICAEYRSFAARLNIGDVRFIPMSALNGDMVVDRGEALTWYQGPTLLDILEFTPPAHTERDEPFRFPVQYVCRPQKSEDQALHDFRGFMGRIESGEIAVGDQILALPSGTPTRILGIQIGDISLPRAHAEQSVTLLLEDDIDISRGDLFVCSDEPANVVRQIEATICWLADAPLDRQRKYIVRHTTREVKALFSSIDKKLDLNSLTTEPAEGLARNDIAQITLKLAQPLYIDFYTSNRATGAFIVIDEANNNTVAAGMIRKAE
jgi:sulfate adenylyltransferase subunit 1